MRGCENTKSAGDPTPGDDSEFTTAANQGELHRMDLPTVLVAGNLARPDDETRSGRLAAVTGQ